MSFKPPLIKQLHVVIGGKSANKLACASNGNFAGYPIFMNKPG
jgi:hypothetical protein